MEILVAVFSPNAAWTMPRAFIDRLRRDFPQHTFLDAWDTSEVNRLLPDVAAAFSAYIDRDMPVPGRLRWLQAPAVGVGHLLSTGLVASQVVVTSARGVRARAMAEHVLGVTLALSRQLHLAVRRQVERRWALDELEGRIRTLNGRRMTIVGLGSIGQEVARLAAAVGMRVSGIRKRTDLPRPAFVEEVVEPGRLHELLGRSDVIVLSAPLTDETRHLIDADALAHTKHGALLINVGRGKLIDDDAVTAALEDGRLGGAGLDVFTKEPLDPASPYWTLPNVIVTPHISGAMEDYWTPLVDLFAENLRRFEAGQPLLNVVDKEAGY